MFPRVSQLLRASATFTAVLAPESLGLEGQLSHVKVRKNSMRLEFSNQKPCEFSCRPKWSPSSFKSMADFKLESKAKTLSTFTTGLIPNSISRYILEATLKGVLIRLYCTGYAHYGNTWQFLFQDKWIITCRGIADEYRPFFVAPRYA